MSRSSWPVNQAGGEPARSVSSRAPNEVPSITHHHVAQQGREQAGARDLIDDAMFQKKRLAASSGGTMRVEEKKCDVLRKTSRGERTFLQRAEIPTRLVRGGGVG